ncbi:MAG: hypothetical protein LBN98_02885 [Prevotellaceae bacterium]|nr:hypothetical protein [Prevotellaceae bacterium]
MINRRLQLAAGQLRRTASRTGRYVTVAHGLARQASLVCLPPTPSFGGGGGEDWPFAYVVAKDATPNGAPVFRKENNMDNLVRAEGVARGWEAGISTGNPGRG